MSKRVINGWAHKDIKIKDMIYLNGLGDIHLNTNDIGLGTKKETLEWWNQWCREDDMATLPDIRKVRLTLEDVTKENR